MIRTQAFIYKLSQLILTTLRQYTNFYCQFTNEETGTERLNNLPQITQLVSDEFKGDVVAVTHYFMY